VGQTIGYVVCLPTHALLPQAMVNLQNTSQCHCLCREQSSEGRTKERWLWTSARRKADDETRSSAPRLALKQMWKLQAQALACGAQALACGSSAAWDFRGIAESVGIS
jgi:hypothetical protein